MRVERPSDVERRLSAAAEAARAVVAARAGGAGRSVQRQARTSATRFVSFIFFLGSEDIWSILFGVPRPARPPRANARRGLSAPLSSARRTTRPGGSGTFCQK